MDRHRQGLDKLRYKGLIRRFDGLSIIYITALQTRRQIDKAICRQIDKPQYGAYHQSNGLSNLKSKTVYKEIPNIPIDIQTISSGYKGLDKRFGYMAKYKV